MSSLIEKAEWVWQETLKIHQRAPETRVASSLSCVEIFVSLYYGGYFKFNSENPYDESRDRCVISKGHGSLCMYPILADLGFFSLSELEKVCQEGSFLGGIPDPVIPGYETINGSLGHGMGVGAGIALAIKRKKMPQNVVVIVGDGELHEGSNWEAAMFAAQQKIDNLTVIVDNNKTCMLDRTENVVDHISLKAKFSSFGWDAVEADGHSIADMNGILPVLLLKREGKPKILIADTIKGHGVPDLENASLSHVLTVNAEKIEELLKGKH